MQSCAASWVIFKFYTFLFVLSKVLININLCDHTQSSFYVIIIILFDAFFLQGLSSSNITARSHGEASQINPM